MISDGLSRSFRRMDQEPYWQTYFVPELRLLANKFRHLSLSETPRWNRKSNEVV